MNPLLSVDADPPRRWPSAVRFVVYALLLFASWNHNVLGIPGGVTWYRAEPRVEYYGYDSFLVLNRLRLAADGAHPAYPLATFVAEDGPTPYTSQVGGQGIALAVLQEGLGFEPHEFATGAVAVFGLLTAAVYAGVFVVAGRRFGPLVGDVAALLAAPAPIMLQFAPSLYWVPFLMAGPFALVWAYGGCVGEDRRAWGMLLATVGLLVFAKALCGYEYIVTVIAAPVAALWYHQHVWDVPLLRRPRAAFALCAAGVTGFGLAMAVHAGQLRTVLGLDPVQTIAERASYRLQGESRDEVRRTFATDRFDFLPDRYAYAANCFVEYFDQPVLATPAHWGRRHVGVPLKYLVLLTLVAGIVAAIRPCGRNFGGLVGAAGIALLAGAAWQVVALNHMCVHTHLNGIVYSLAFVPLALIVVGCGVNALAGVLRVRLLLPGFLLVLAAGTIVSSLLAADRRARETDASDAAAVTAVEKLPLGAKPQTASVAITIDQFGTERLTHPNFPVDLGRVTQLDPADGREPALFLLGWTTDLQPSKRPRSPRLVVTVNGSVIPAWIGRHGRPDVDKSLNRKRPEAAFLIAVPRRLVPDPAALQVFAVAATDPSRITAAKMPAFQP